MLPGRSSRWQIDLPLCLPARVQLCWSQWLTCLRSNIAYDHDFWYTCVKWWYLQVFFAFFWSFIFLGAIRGVKGLKIPQNGQWQLHLPCAISQEQCNIWSWFLVPFCKMMISLGFFFHCFEIFIIWAVRVVKGKSIAQNENNSYICLRHISPTV